MSNNITNSRIRPKFVVCLLLLRGATTEHAGESVVSGESGVQLSVGEEMEAYRDHVATEK